MKHFIKKFCEETIKESEEYLRQANTTYEDVLNETDTSDYSENSENNNFEAGRISVCNKILKLLEVK